MRTINSWLVLLMAACWGMFAVPASAGEFRAAAGKVDITPQPGVDLWGYSDRTGAADGVLDPLYAKTLVLDDGSKRIAIVTLDLGRTFGREALELVRSRVKASVKVDAVFFTASHTHSGPVIDDSYPDGKRPAWETTALDKIGSAIEKAAGELSTARIGTGAGETFIGHNRRLVQADGTVKMLWRNMSKDPTQPLDGHVGVIRVDAASHAPLAILVNYSCHPVVLGPDNLRYSADYVGAMAGRVEKHFGDDAVCLFLQGGAGDINPYYDKMKLQEDGVRLMQETGQQLGDEVIRIAGDVRPTAPEHPSLEFRVDLHHFESRWDVEQVLAALKARLSSDILKRYRKYLESPLDCDVMTLLINDEIALTGMPGEPFVEFATSFRSRSPVRHAFFVGYANGYRGYFPTIKAAVVGGYGANSFVARAQVGAGEAMLNQSIVRLYEMRGQLTAVPPQ